MTGIWTYDPVATDVAWKLNVLGAIHALASSWHVRCFLPFTTAGGLDGRGRPDGESDHGMGIDTNIHHHARDVSDCRRYLAGHRPACGF